MVKNFLTLGALIGLSLAVPSAKADFITGTFGLSGNGVLSFTSGGFGFIDWAATGGGNGAATVGGVSGGYIGKIATGNAGTILDVTNNPTPPVGFSYLPISPTSTSLANFVTVGPISVTAFNIINQTCAPSLAQFCTGGFKFTQNSGSVSVSLEIAGFVLHAGDQSPITSGLFTGNFSDAGLNTIAEVLAAANTVGGAFSPSWSATITTVTPEPTTYALVGSVLVAVGLLRRRRSA